jgi:hypothetical protein
VANRESVLSRFGGVSFKCEVQGGPRSGRSDCHRSRPCADGDCVAHNALCRVLNAGNVNLHALHLLALAWEGRKARGGRSAQDAHPVHYLRELDQMAQGSFGFDRPQHFDRLSRIESDRIRDVQ